MALNFQRIYHDKRCTPYPLVIPDFYWIRVNPWRWDASLLPAEVLFTKRQSSFQLRILSNPKPAQLEGIHDKKGRERWGTHVSPCLLIILLNFNYIFSLRLSLRTISAITSRGETLSQGGGSTVAPRLPEWGGEKRGEGGNGDVYSKLNHWSLLHAAMLKYYQL